MSERAKRHAVPAGRLGRSAGTGVAGAAVVTVVTWCLEQFTGVTVPAEIGAAAATVVAWLLALATPEPGKDPDA